MTEKSKPYDTKAADAVDVNEPAETAAKTLLIDAAEEPLSTTDIGSKAVEVKERVWGYLLGRKSPINVGISDMTSKLHLTEDQASDALKTLDAEGKLSVGMVRATVFVREG
jgi:hypothetical protein